MNRVSVAEMRMIRWMSENKKRLDRHENIGHNLGVASIEDRMSENHLRWFGHVWRRPEHVAVKMSDGIQTTTKKKKRKSKGNVVRDNYKSHKDM